MGQIKPPNWAKGTCQTQDGQLLAYAHVHHCGPTCPLQGFDVPTIEHLAAFVGDSKSLHAISHAMIDEYRRMMH